MLICIYDTLYVIMDPQQITTTFIPKKPVIETAAVRTDRIPQSVSLAGFFAVGMLIVTAVGIGGIYVYRDYVQKQIIEQEISLNKSEKSFEPNLLQELTTVDKKLKNAAIVFKQHKALSPVFDILESVTLPNVRYTRFDFSFNESGNATVNLSGETDSYTAIAMQSQSLSEVTAFQNVIFSDFTRTPKKLVAFNVSLTVKPELLIFTQAPRKSTLVVPVELQSAVPAVTTGIPVETLNP